MNDKSVNWTGDLLVAVFFVAFMTAMLFKVAHAQMPTLVLETFIPYLVQ